MTFCKIAPPTSGTGNATVRIIALKNTSATPRSQKFVVTSNAGLARSITVNQAGAILPALEWPASISFGQIKTSKDVSASCILKNVKDAVVGNEINLNSLIVFSINGEESSDGYALDDIGVQLTGKITSVSNTTNGGNEVGITFYLEIKNDLSYVNKINSSYSTDDSGLDYSKFSFYINSIAGLDGETVESPECKITVYKQALSATPSGSALILTPQSPQLALEDSVEFTVKYTKIIPDSLAFNAGPEMNDYVTQDTWNPPAPTGGVDASGSFTFSIGATSDASEGTYTFTITATNINGESIIAKGEVRVVP